MNSATTRGLVFIGVIGVLLVSACADDKEEANAPTTMSKAEFIEAGDAICEQSNEQLNPLARAAFDTADLPGAAEAWEQIILLDREKIRALRALEVPAGDEARVEELLDGFEAAMLNAQPILAAATAGDAAAFEAALAQHGEGFAVVGPNLAEYGFEVCG